MTETAGIATIAIEQIEATVVEEAEAEAAGVEAEGIAEVAADIEDEVVAIVTKD